MRATVTTQTNITIAGELRQASPLIISVDTKNISPAQTTDLVHMGGSVTAMPNGMWHVCIPMSKVSRYKFED